MAGGFFAFCLCANYSQKAFDSSSRRLELTNQHSDHTSRSFITLSIIESLEAEDWKLKGDSHTIPPLPREAVLLQRISEAAQPLCRVPACTKWVQLKIGA